MKKLKIGAPIAFLALIFLSYTAIKLQGLGPSFWSSFGKATVVFDSDGIPTITADTWKRLIYAQGYVTASERLWQMDLARRQVSGRLSEWFGEKFVQADIAKQIEDRLQVADDAIKSMPAEERQFCEAYAEGVNDFINEHSLRWGIEYLIQRRWPEPWSCRDSALILIEMAEQLTNKEQMKLMQEEFKFHLPLEWKEFLFSQNHPWNAPMFGDIQNGNDVVAANNWLKMTPLPSHELAQVPHLSVNGSNSWAYRGRLGAYIANDPHLKNTVPSIWYLSRLQLLDGRWVVGASVPGSFGIIIGMNRDIAWSFTNTGVDVDNILWEKVDEAKGVYLDRDAQGKEIWKPIKKKNFTIKVARGDDVQVVGEFTERGPLKRYKKERYYSRQWMALKPQYLRAPFVAVNQAKSIEEADLAFAGMTNPSQNVIIGDRRGNLLYRPTGVFLERQPKTGPYPIDALNGQWLGIKDIGNRWHISVPNTKSKHSFLATANERIWIDPFGHFWSDDDRKDRIRSVLEDSPDLTQEHMQNLQLDGQSRFKKTLLDWIAAHVSDKTIDEGFKERIQVFSGDAKQDSELFRFAFVMEKDLLTLLIAQIKLQFFPKKGEDVPYLTHMPHALMLKTLLHPSSTAIFGLEPKQVADHLWEIALKEKGKHHEIENRWQSQHPFANNFSLISWLFRIKEIDQFGEADTVNAQRPDHGPSLRVIWNLIDPEKSTWIIPVGQSGHIGNSTFNNMQQRWQEGDTIPVF